MIDRIQKINPDVQNQHNKENYTQNSIQKKQIGFLDVLVKVHSERMENIESNKLCNNRDDRDDTLHGKY